MLWLAYDLNTENLDSLKWIFAIQRERLNCVNCGHTVYDPSKDGVLPVERTHGVGTNKERS